MNADIYSTVDRTDNNGYINRATSSNRNEKIPTKKIQLDFGRMDRLSDKEKVKGSTGGKGQQRQRQRRQQQQQQNQRRLGTGPKPITPPVSTPECPEPYIEPSSSQPVREPSPSLSPTPNPTKSSSSSSTSLPQSSPSSSNNNNPRYDGVNDSDSKTKNKKEGKRRN